ADQQPWFAGFQRLGQAGHQGDHAFRLGAQRYFLTQVVDHPHHALSKLTVRRSASTLINRTVTRCPSVMPVAGHFASTGGSSMRISALPVRASSLSPSWLPSTRSTTASNVSPT